MPPGQTLHIHSLSIFQADIDTEGKGAHPAHLEAGRSQGHSTATFAQDLLKQDPQSFANVRITDTHTPLASFSTVRAPDTDRHLSKEDPSPLRHAVSSPLRSSLLQYAAAPAQDERRFAPPKRALSWSRRKSQAGKDTGWGPGSKMHRTRFMLAPQGKQRIVWDLVTMLILLWLTISMPFTIGFEIESTGFWLWFERSIDFFFMCDILVNFRTGAGRIAASLFLFRHA